MKKVIDGKVYNTDTAKCLVSNYVREIYGRWGMKDISGGIEEELYRTNKGNYFIFIARREPIIVPIGINDAIRWLEEFDEVEIIEEYFNEYISEA